MTAIIVTTIICVTAIICVILKPEIKITHTQLVDYTNVPVQEKLPEQDSTQEDKDQMPTYDDILQGINELILEGSE